MSDQDAMTGEGWLTHATALRVLAAALTRDPGEADDLVQETWLRAQRGGELPDRPRSWWSTVLRNLVRDRARERAKRTRTERYAARDERMPSDVEVLERLEIAQRVAAEVGRLDEPYRAAIHLRYFEGLSPEEIAQRSGEPLETVRARLRRGLAQLRERMDRACGGDRTAWSVSLAAIAFRGEPAAFANVGGSLISIGGIVVSAKIALGVAAAMVIGLGVYLLRPSSDAAKPNREMVVEAPATEVVAPPAEQLAANEAPISARAPIPAPIAPAPVVADHGTIVVLDEAGTEHASESGTFSLVLTKPRNETAQIEVKEGSWSSDLPEGATFYVNMITLGGRSALPLPNSGPFIAGGTLPQLRCQWTTLARLHVVDAVSGAELDGIRLYTVPTFEAVGIELMVQRPKTGLVGEELVSPIEVSYAPTGSGALASSSSLPTHFAVRSGYAWGNIQIDPTAGGDFVLRLQPGGDLQATFDGARRDARLRARLYERGSELKLVSEWGGQEIDRGPPPALQLEGLSVGSYVMRAEVGKQHEAKVLAEQEFAITAGAKASITLAVGPMPKAEKIEVVVTVKMDPAWTFEEFVLWVQPLDVPRSPSALGEFIRSSEMTVVEPGTWTSKPILLSGGRHECLIDELYFSQEVRVGPDPRQQVLLEIPAPTRVVIHAVDGETGGPLLGSYYSCAWKASGGSRLFGGQSGRTETAPGECEILAPLGTAKLSVGNPDCRPEAKTLELVPGLNEVSITLHRTYRIELILREGEKVVPWTMRAMDTIKFERLDGQRSWAGMSFGHGRLTCSQPEAGSYRVIIPKIPGYLPIEPFEVDLEERKVLEKVIQIVRE
ncbi:MAG TPA: RNA polymerase sigma factor [Planctomycetota bacterium]|nr:RNA polymerase sigma factor [Planctomycetota bacterium]